MARIALFRARSCKCTQKKRKSLKTAVNRQIRVFSQCVNKYICKGVFLCISVHSTLIALFLGRIFNSVLFTLITQFCKVEFAKRYFLGIFRFFWKRWK